MTLAELIVTLAITGIVLSIISVFITDGIESVTQNDVKMSSYEQNIEFKNYLSDFFASGVGEVEVFSGITSPTYTGTPSTNNIIFLQNTDGTEGSLIGNVNFETKLLQRNNIYGNNFLGYRELSSGEINEINSNSGAIYSKEFNTGNIYDDLRIKEFKANYMTGNILNINYVLDFSSNQDLFGDDYSEVFVGEDSLEKYNLIF